MIAVQMRDEDVIDALEFDFVFAQLHLRSFAAIDEKKFVVHIHHLRRRMMSGSGRGCTAAKNGHVKSHFLFSLLWASVIGCKTFESALNVSDKYGIVSTVLD